MYFRLSLVLALALMKVTFASECQNETIKNFYKLVKETHPIESEIKKRLEASSSLIDQASLRPNPEINFEYQRGDEFGLKVNTYSLGALHTFEFGDKRQKRIKASKFQNQIEKEDLKLQKLSAQVDSVLTFQRLAQIDIKIKNLKEAISTFQKILKRLTSRTRLNPEERISVTTLSLATNDYEARLNDFQNEKELLLGEIEFITKCKNYTPKYQILPYKNASFIQEDESGLLKIEKLKPDFFKAEFEKEKSLGYSDIKIGPLVEYKTQGEDEFVSAGVVLSFSLPLFNTNNGGKKIALKKWQAQKIASKNEVTKLKIQKQRQKQNYKRSLDVFNKMPSLISLEKGHKEVEKLFSRGIVSIPLVIESHRQLIDFLESRFETENDLLTALKELAVIDGDTKIIETLLK